MGIGNLPDEWCQQAVDAFNKYGNKAEAARHLSIPVTTLKSRLDVAARRGMCGFAPVLPGFEISGTSTQFNENGDVEREWIRQVPEGSGAEFEVPFGHVVKGVSALVGPNGQVLNQWIKTKEDATKSLEILREVADELKKDLPRIDATPAPKHTNKLLLNQYTITDLHLGMLAWGEETRDHDYDLGIAEKLLMDWFSAAIEMAPNAEVGVFAQLGDFLHHDSLRSVTPKHEHVLDADSRLQKIIRVAIRTIKRIIQMLLDKHPKVHIISAMGNHDPASSGWLREMMASMYEDEPRLTVDTSPDPYYSYEFGKVALFYHHGDRKAIDKVDTVFAGKFREIYGRSEFAYGHVGHRHSTAKKETNLMLIEQHRTLAPPDAHSSGGGWLSDQDAQVLTYHANYGEVSRITISPKMLGDRT